MNQRVRSTSSRASSMPLSTSVRSDTQIPQHPPIGKGQEMLFGTHDIHVSAARGSHGGTDLAQPSSGVDVCFDRERTSKKQLGRMLETTYEPLQLSRAWASRYPATQPRIFPHESLVIRVGMTRARIKASEKRSSSRPTTAASLRPPDTLPAVGGITSWPLMESISWPA